MLLLVIREEISITIKAAQRMAKPIWQVLPARSEGWLPEVTGEVEANDIHIKGEQKGSGMGHTQGLSERGPATYAVDRRWWCLERNEAVQDVSSDSAGVQARRPNFFGAFSRGEGERSLPASKHETQRGIRHRGRRSLKYGRKRVADLPILVAAGHREALIVSVHSFRRTYRGRSRIERTRTITGFLIAGLLWARRYLLRRTATSVS